MSVGWDSGVDGSDAPGSGDVSGSAVDGISELSAEASGLVSSTSVSRALRIPLPTASVRGSGMVLLDTSL